MQSPSLLRQPINELELSETFKQMAECNDFRNLQDKQKHNSRNHVKGKFGQGKNGYELNEIKAMYSNTSKSWIAAIIRNEHPEL